LSQGLSIRKVALALWSYPDPVDSLYYAAS